MKKVLIIAHDFYRKEIISSIRVQGLANYLPEFGWEPVILTSESYRNQYLNNFKLIEIPYVNYKLDEYNKYYKKFGIYYRLFNRFWNELFAEPYDYYIDWLNPVLDQLQFVFQNEHFDAIISTSPPETAHIIANNFKKIFDIPWIADLRDLWTGNHYYGYLWFRKIRERKLERETFAYANAMITVSEPLVKKLQELHPKKNIYCIPNGFDPILKCSNNTPTEKFSITYTGKIMSGILKKYRNPEPLFKAIKELIDHNLLDPNQISIDFFGSSPSWLKKEIIKFQLEEIVKIHGVISREDSIIKQRKSQILLLLTWNNPHEEGVLTGKIFDYFAAQRPILSIGHSGGIISKILKTTQAGMHMSKHEDIKNQILHYYQEFLQQGFISYCGIQSEIDKYSHREMAGKFAQILNIVSEEKMIFKS